MKRDMFKTGLKLTKILIGHASARSVTTDKAPQPLYYIDDNNYK